MNEDLEEVLKRQKSRYKLLHLIYKGVAGKKDYQMRYVEVSQLIEVTEMNDEDVYEAVDYLVEEGLLSSIGDEFSAVSLTHRGKVEMERSITHPHEPTEHFMGQVVQHFHAPVGVVQTGAYSTASITQHLSFDTTEMLRLVTELRQNIDSLKPENRAEAIELVQGLEEEAQLANPRIGRVKAFLRELGSLATSSNMERILSVLHKSLGL
jgi:hypothetical protein